MGGWWQAVEVCGQVSWDPVGGFINTFSGLASFDSVHIFWQFLGILLVWFASRSLERSKSQELGALRCSALSASIYYSVNAFHPRFKKHLQRWQKSGNCLQSLLSPRCSVRPQPERPRVRGRRRRFWRKPRPSSCWFILLSVGVLTCLRRHTHTSHISLQHLIHPLQQTSGPVCRLETRPDPGLSASSFQKHSVFSQCAAFSWSFIKCREKWTREKNDEFLTGFRFGFLFWFCWFSGGCSWLGSGTCTLLLKGNQPTVCLENKAGNSGVTRKS